MAYKYLAILYREKRMHIEHTSVRNIFLLEFFDFYDFNEARAKER